MDCGDCPICLEPLNVFDSGQKMECQHHFHINCISGILSFSCPMCRKDITNSLTKVQRNMIHMNIARKHKESVVEELDNTQISIEDFLGAIMLMSHLLSMVDERILTIPKTRGRRRNTTASTQPQPPEPSQQPPEQPPQSPQQQ